MLSIVDPSLSNVDLNMSLMPPLREHDDEDDATIDDVPSLSEDFGHYDSHEENDDTFPELNFASQHSRMAATHSNLTTATMATNLVNTSTPVDYQVLPGQQEYPLPTYDEAMQIDSSVTSTPPTGTHYYPDESKVTYRHKDMT